MVRRRRIDTISDIGRDILTRIDPHGERHQSRAVQAWPEVAGAEIVKHTKGFAMKEGELVVFVDAPAWANELTLMAERLKKDLNLYIGQDSVSGIRFVVSKKVQEERHWELSTEEDNEFYKPDTIPPVSLSDDELRQARYMAGAIPDAELREKALRTMIRDLEAKKGARAAKAAQRANGEPRGTDSGS